jgi:hypothetical protein
MSGEDKLMKFTAFNSLCPFADSSRVPQIASRREASVTMGINLLVYEFLTDERDDTTGLVGPIRNEDIAAVLGLSTTSAAFAVAALQEFRLIRRVRRHRIGSIYSVNTGSES